MLEQLLGQNKAIFEVLGGMQLQVAKISGIEESIYELRQDMSIVKAVMRDTNRQVYDHESRIVNLETARR